MFELVLIEGRSLWTGLGSGELDAYSVGVMAPVRPSPLSRGFSPAMHSPLPPDSHLTPSQMAGVWIRDGPHPGVYLASSPHVFSCQVGYWIHSYMRGCFQGFSCEGSFPSGVVRFRGTSCFWCCVQAPVGPSPLG